jgi:hypothetical protein
MQVEVRAAKKLGLEVFRVYLNNTMVAEFLSIEMANSKALQFKQYINAKGV